jgi:hypothetical protein
MFKQVCRALEVALWDQQPARFQLEPRHTADKRLPLRAAKSWLESVVSDQAYNSGNERFDVHSASLQRVHRGRVIAAKARQWAALLDGPIVEACACTPQAYL